MLGRDAGQAEHRQHRSAERGRHHRRLRVVVDRAAVRHLEIDQRRVVERGLGLSGTTLLAMGVHSDAWASVPASSEKAQTRATEVEFRGRDIVVAPKTLRSLALFEPPTLKARWSMPRSVDNVGFGVNPSNLPVT